VDERLFQGLACGGGDWASSDRCLGSWWCMAFVRPAPRVHDLPRGLADRKNGGNGQTTVATLGDLPAQKVPSLSLSLSLSHGRPYGRHFRRSTATQCKGAARIGVALGTCLGGTSICFLSAERPLAWGALHRAAAPVRGKPGGSIAIETVQLVPSRKFGFIAAIVGQEQHRAPACSNDLPVLHFTRTHGGGLDSLSEYVVHDLSLPVGSWQALGRSALMSHF